MAATDPGPVAARLFTADDVSKLLLHFAGPFAADRWQQHVDADARDVVNVGEPCEACHSVPSTSEGQS